MSLNGAVLRFRESGVRRRVVLLGERRPSSRPTPTAWRASGYLVGFSDNQAAYHPANGNEIAVRYDPAGGGCPANESTTNWVYEVIVGGTKTCVNSGLAVAANTWYHVRIYSATPGHDPVPNKWREFGKRSSRANGHTGSRSSST